jgi:LmbE family N-acetylglucosaminyl deacetylase
MASVFATVAYHWAGRTNRYADQLGNGLRPHRTQKLYYSTAGFTLPERQPVAMPPQTAKIDIADALESKIRAFKAHRTQAPLVPFFEKRVRELGHWELYHLAASVHPETMQAETDLFERVADE